jgi:hypothetical protein
MSSDSSNDSALEEWKETRAVLARFDDNLHDLRKYGLIFLASLLTADSLQAYLALPEFTRCMLLVITIAFIVALRLLDHNYHNLQTAALIRSRILEVNLNIELSETISEHYKNTGLPDFVSRLYYGFIAITVFLGIALLFPVDSSLTENKILFSIPYFIGFSIAAVIGIIFIHVFSRDLSISYERLSKSGHEDVNDWILDRVSCEQGESVKITITNLGKETIFHENDIAFTILDDENNVRYEARAKKEITLWKFDNYSWLWNTSDVDADKIYRVVPRGRGHFPLRRSIVVHKKGAQPKQKTAKPEAEPRMKSSNLLKERKTD